ncbi:Uncharacterized protein PBTT_07312 [Plasmodiophora brassicae]
MQLRQPGAVVDIASRYAPHVIDIAIISCSMLSAIFNLCKIALGLAVTDSIAISILTWLADVLTVASSVGLIYSYRQQNQRTRDTLTTITVTGLTNQLRASYGNAKQGSRHLLSILDKLESTRPGRFVGNDLDADEWLAIPLKQGQNLSSLKKLLSFATPIEFARFLTLQPPPPSAFD